MPAITDAMSPTAYYGMYDGPVVDGSCPNLPEAGTWQNVSPPGSNYTKTYTGIDSVVVRPDNPAVVFAGAELNGIFKSTDCGANWTLVSTGANAASMASGRPWSFRIDPVTPDRMYAVNGYGALGLWMTDNGGVDWQQILTPNIELAFSFVNSVTLDPTDHTHLVIMAHGGQDSDAGACGTDTCIAESTDEGMTWKFLTIPVPWGEGSGIIILNRTTWLHNAYHAYWYTVDEGVTWQSVALANASLDFNGSQDYFAFGPAGQYVLPANLSSGSGGIFQSYPDAGPTSWSPIPNSPQGSIMMATTNNIVVGGGTSASTATWWIAPQSNLTNWSALSGPNTASVPGVASTSLGGAAVYADYDGTHHVLYEATNCTGLWQTVIP